MKHYYTFLSTIYIYLYIYIYIYININIICFLSEITIGLCFTDDADLAGPLIFCLLFGSLLLASGNVHFGYIYGMALMACGGNLIFLNS